MAMELDDLAVAQFLRAEPLFFERNLRLLDDIVLPDPHGGAAISLVERQQSVMRERVRSLEIKLSELVKFGEENDVISERVHRLTLALMRARDLASLLYATSSALREDFLVPHVALRLWGGKFAETDSDRPELAAVEPALRNWAEELTTAYCGHRPGMDIAGWFGATPAPLKSFAILPLRGAGSLGLLALGSEDEQRFYPEMGTLYLKRIAELVSRALERLD